MRKIVAIDGPAGSGKGTVAKILAEKCNLLYIDTGAMYRAIAYKTLQNNIDLSEEEKVLLDGLCQKICQRAKEAIREK